MRGSVSETKPRSGGGERDPNATGDLERPIARFMGPEALTKGSLDVLHFGLRTRQHRVVELDGDVELHVPKLLEVPMAPDHLDRLDPLHREARLLERIANGRVRAHREGARAIGACGAAVPQLLREQPEPWIGVARIPDGE